jgi:hypothetical protein
MNNENIPAVFAWRERFARFGQDWRRWRFTEGPVSGSSYDRHGQMLLQREIVRLIPTARKCALCISPPALLYDPDHETPGWLGPNDYICESCADTPEGIEYILSKTRPQIVCVCGSSRFIEHHAVVKFMFEKAGAIALGMHLLPQWYPGVTPHHQAETEGVSQALDELHRRKIDMADAVVVVTVDGYYGDQTRSEIAYARKYGKDISFWDFRSSNNELSVRNDVPRTDSRVSVRGSQIVFDGHVIQGISKDSNAEA